MMRRTFAPVVFIMALWAGPAFALQPLEAFLQSSHQANLEVRASRADAAQRNAEVDVARARLFPSFTARGVFPHNQHNAQVELPGQDPRVITPQNQLDAFFTFDVPVLDLGQHARLASQRAQAAIAASQTEVSQRNVEQRIVRAYYTFAATEGLKLAAARSLAVATENQRLVEGRLTSGTASALDRDRAKANVERARQDIADSDLAHAIAARSLETLSGLTPEALQQQPAPDLSDEAALETWLERVDPNLPELRAARASAELAGRSRDAARFAFAPVLSAQAQERLTNATGFAGQAASYAISGNVTFRLDFGLVPQLEVARAAEEAAVARAQNTRRAVEDSIIEAHHRVRAGIAKLTSAQAQAEAAAHAAQVSAEQYAAGASTQLDVTTAQKDAFAADVGRLQAILDLAQARATLRLVSGTPL